jgi:hypothetical protein
VVQVVSVQILIHLGQQQPAQAFQVITQAAVAVVLTLQQVQVVQVVVVQVQVAHRLRALQTLAVAVVVHQTSAVLRVVQV